MIELQQWEKAQAPLKHAISIEPDNQEAFNPVGVALELKGEMVPAEKNVPGRRCR